MKYFSILIGLFFFHSCATTYPFQVGFPNPNFERIVDTKYNKDEAFVIANGWLVEQMVSAKDVIQYSDKEAGMLKGKFYIHYSRMVSGGQTGIVEVSGIITIMVKDNKAKIQIDVSGEKNQTLIGTYDKWTESELNEYKAKVDYLLNDFEKTMTEEVNSDW